MRLGTSLALLAAALGLVSCTFQPGVAFGTLTGATLTTRFQPDASRLDAEGRIKTDTGYRIRVDSLQLVVGKLDFQSTTGTSGSTGGGTFDPANPPPGYTLCHGGHCHRDDGALVSYEDIEAELSGGTATTRTVVSLPVEAPFNLLSGSATASISECEPGCQLDRGTWSQAVLHLTSLTATGSVEDPSAFDRLGGQTRTWSLTLTQEAFSRKVDVTLDRTQGDRLAVAATFALSEKLWDAIDFKTLAETPGTLVLDELADNRQKLSENLSQSQFNVTVTR